MAYIPISKTVPQYTDESTGLPYSGAVLKAYESGTSTVLPMATDSTGGTTATSMALNSAGYPEVSGNIVIPHVNENYKLSLYPTQAAADADTGAIWTVDSIKYTDTPGITDDSNAVAITIDASEDVTFTGTALFAAGEGIVFNSDPLAAANTLDDYEEGTWTPVLSDGTNNATSATAVGTYTKIGRVIFFKAYLIITSLGSVSGALRITGLPVASDGTGSTNSSVECGYGDALAIAAGTKISGQIPPASSYVLIYLWDATTGVTPMQSTEWTLDGELMFSGFYFV